MADSDLVSLVADQENIRRAAGAYSGFADEPGLAVSLARSGATAEQMRAVAGFTEGLQLSTKVALARQSGIQIDLDNRQRAILTAVGSTYADVDKVANQAQVAPPEQHLGILGTVAKYANDATKLPGIKQGLHVLDRAADITNTVYRQGSELGLFGGGPNAANYAADIGQQTADMQRTGYNPNNVISQLTFYAKGNQVYHNLDDLRATYSPDQVEMAQTYLQDPGKFVDATLSDDELSKRQHLLMDPQFKELTTEVNARHISVGRDIAAGLGLHPGSSALPTGGLLTSQKKIDTYNAVSGSIDGVWSFYADPTLIAGRTYKGVKAIRYGIDDLSDSTRIRALMEGNTAVKRGWSELLESAREMRNGTKAEAAAAYARVRAGTPELVPMLDEINGGGLRAGQPIEWYSELVDHVISYGSLARMRNGLAAMETPLMPGALPRIGYRAVKANLAARRTGKAVESIDLETRADQFVATAADAVNGLGADATGLDAATTAAVDSAAVGQAALEYRRTLKGRLSMLGQRMTTLLPEHNRIDLTSAEGAEDIRRFAAMYMSRSHANLLAARYAVASVGERRSIAQAAYDQTIHAAGVPSSLSGRAWLADQHANRALLANSAYDASGKGLDRIAGAAGEPERRAALYGGQTSTDFYLPNFAELRRFAAKVSIYDHTMRSGLESAGMDTAMGALRTSWLLSPASAIRNGIENLLSAVFRGASADEIARSRAALSSSTARRVADRAKDLSERDVSPNYRPMRGSPLGYLRGVYHGRLVSGMKHAEAVMGETVSGAKRSKRAEELLEDEMSGDLKELDAISGLATRGSAESVDDAALALDRGFKVSKVSFKNMGYQLDSADGHGGARYWAQQLHMRFKDTEGIHVLKAARSGLGSDRERLVEHLLSPEYRTTRAKLERFQTLRDGTKVMSDDVTKPMVRRAAEELADDQIEDMRALLTGRNGAFNHEVADSLEAGHVPSVDMLKKVKDEFRPAQVIQPKFIVDLDSGGTTAGNVVQSLADKGYHLAVARPLAWMSSLPIYHANYTRAYDRVEKMMLANHPDWSAEDIAMHVRDVARQHAMDLTVQMIDNPRVRSQMSLITRNVFNFWRAQEDFLRRWGRNLHENPAALRETQLAIEGGMHTGLVHKDDQDQLVFSYPGSGVAIQGVGKALSVFGLGNSVGLGTVPNMTTKLQFLNAGLDRPFLPSTSPVASIPLRVLRHFSHDNLAIIQAQSAAEGNIGASRGWWQQFIPSPVQRFIMAQSSDDREGQFASATRNAALNLYAAGLAPGPDATPDEVDAFKKRIQIGVRNHLTARAVLALILPGAPSSPTEETDASKAGDLEAKAYNTVSLKQEFSQWVAKYGYQRALSLWTTNHPDDLAYTVSTTEGAGGTGGYLSPTDEVLGWMQDNPDLVKNYPALAAYFAPNGPGDFSQDAWQTELELGLRQHKDLTTYYRDVAVKGAETAYFKQRDQRDKLVAEATAAGNDEEARRLKASFSDWLSTYKAVNPLLVEKWQDSAANHQRIAALVSEVNKLGSDPLVKRIDPNGDLAAISAAYAKKKQYDDTHPGRTNDQKAANDRVNTSYLEYMAGVLQRSPQLIPVYQGVFDKVE